MIAPASPAELTPAAGAGPGPVVGTATVVCVPGVVVDMVDPAGVRLVVVGARVWVMGGVAGR
jgi:hypothetical protein